MKVDSAKNHFKQRGAAFSVPLADGRFGACRVLRAEPEKDDGMSLVAATPYVGAKPPAISEPSLAAILLMQSVGCDKAQRILGDDYPCVWWQRWMEPPPADWQYIGVVEPAPAEARMNPDAYSRYWDNWARNILQEWRWQNDRERFIADFDRTYGAGWIQSVLEEKKRLSHLTLPLLRKRRSFPGWDEFAPARIVRNSRKIVKEAIDGLIGLGSRPTKKEAVPILKHYIESFNSLEHDFDTIEREHILDVFYEMIRVAGLKGCDQLADQWRDF